MTTTSLPRHWDATAAATAVGGPVPTTRSRTRVAAPLIVVLRPQNALFMVVSVVHLPKKGWWLWLLLFLVLLRTTLVQFQQAHVLTSYSDPALLPLLLQVSAATVEAATSATATATTPSLSANLVDVVAHPMTPHTHVTDASTSSSSSIPPDTEVLRNGKTPGDDELTQRQQQRKQQQQHQRKKQRKKQRRNQRQQQRHHSADDSHAVPRDGVVYLEHSWNGSTASMEHLVTSYFVNSPTQPYCEALATENIRQSPNTTTNASTGREGVVANFAGNASPSTVVVHRFDLSQGCQHLFDTSEWGTGNFISYLYGLRLVTHAHNANVLKKGRRDNNGTGSTQSLVALNMTCPDAQQAKRSLVLPWLMGHILPPSRQSGAPTTLPVNDIPRDLSVADACAPNYNSRNAYLVREMQYDFRRMAIGLVGVVGLSSSPTVSSAQNVSRLNSNRHQEHPSVAFARTYLGLSAHQDAQYANKSDTASFHSPAAHSGATPASSLVPQIADVSKPVYANIELDDVVIHFRCGDLINIDLKYYSFLKFKSYTQHISPEARSIGIITQYIPPPASPAPNGTSATGSFTGSGSNTAGQTRINDRNTVVHDRCRAVVQAFYDHIQQRHPHSRVTVHNGPKETIALAYARMVMANQTIVSSTSTFGVFPLVATFGTGYFLYSPRGSPIRWMLRPKIDTLISNVRLIRDPDNILTGDMKKLWEKKGTEAALAWFQS